MSKNIVISSMVLILISMGGCFFGYLEGYEPPVPSAFEQCTDICRNLFFTEANTWNGGEGVSEQKNICVERCLSERNITN